MDDPYEDELKILQQLFTTLTVHQLRTALSETDGDVNAAAELLVLAPPTDQTTTDQGQCPMCSTMFAWDELNIHVQRCMPDEAEVMDDAAGMHDEDLPPLLTEAEQRDFEMAKLMQSHLDMETEVKELRQENERAQKRARKLESDRDLRDVPVSVNFKLDSVACPDYWDHGRDGLHSIDIDSTTDEWGKVASHFAKTLPNNTIHRIERIQNPRLWNYYGLKREEISAKNGGNPNERWMFHGSRASAYDTIITDGFDMRVASMKGAIGAGVYFGETAAVSSGYSTASKKMIYARVVVGSMGHGKPGIRRPPEKSNWLGWGPKSFYDSVGQQGTMVAIFDNNQAYPEYIIHYT